MQKENQKQIVYKRRKIVVTYLRDYWEVNYIEVCQILTVFYNMVYHCGFLVFGPQLTSVEKKKKELTVFKMVEWNKNVGLQ